MGLNGACLCGAVRFSGNADPVFQVKCHCADCRKTAGSHAAMVGVPEGAVAFTGEARESVWTSSAAAWDFVTPGVPSFPKSPA